MTRSSNATHADVWSNVVVAATNSSEPVFPGDAVEAGTHVNGVGSFTPEMREVDADFIARAEVFVDSRSAAMEEAGELIQTIRQGVVGEDHIRAELGEIVRGLHPGRSSPKAVTYFKSVGVAVQDLVVAGHVLAEAREKGLGTTVEL